MVGGDFNRKPMNVLLQSFPELVAIEAGATRRGAALDEVYCNVDRCVTQKEILRPLCKENGIESDHHIIAAAARLPQLDRSVKTSFTFRPLTTRGAEEFGRLLLNTDWTIVEGDSSTMSAKLFTELLESYIVRCFPEKTRTTKNNNTPWFNNTTRRLSIKKKRIYKEEGKTDRYKRAKREYDVTLAEAKKCFIDNVIEKTKATRKSGAYYKMVKYFQTKDAPTFWDLSLIHI